MTSDNTILTIAIIAVVVSGIGLYLTYFNIFAFEKILLGPSPQTGTAQVEIVSRAMIDFTYSTLSWGKGYIDPMKTRALLTTLNATQYDFLAVTPGDVINESAGFVMENTGNEALNINFKLQKTMDLWLPPRPGTTTSATLEFWLEDCFETNAPPYVNRTCDYATPGTPDFPDTALSCSVNPIWTSLSTTAVPSGCTLGFTPEPDRDELRVDLRLMLPVTLQDTPTANTNGFIAEFSAV